MKKFFIFLAFTQTISIFACRPNLTAVAHDLAIEALRQAGRIKFQTVLNVSKISKKDTQMFWIHSNPEINCPDKYIISYEIEYSNGKLLKPTVTRFKSDYIVNFL